MQTLHSRMSTALGLILLTALLSACDGSSSTPSSTSAPTGDGDAAANVRAGTDNASGGIDAAFPKSILVFGTRIIGTASVPDEKMLHAANVMAQYLDNNDDGQADNPAVVDMLVARGATLIMAGTESELESLESTLLNSVPDPDSLQGLFGTEVFPAGSTRNAFDATLEEVLHLITHVGYSQVYPEVFGEQPGSVIADAMDIARGGQFTTVPAQYPDSAWYTYDDQTCSYECMVAEYIYWGLTSLLGAQDYPGRFENISNEWRLNTATLMQSGDTAATALLTDPQYALPTVIPDGQYLSTSFVIESTASE